VTDIGAPWDIVAAPAYVQRAIRVLEAVPDPMSILHAAAPGAWTIQWANSAWVRVTGFEHPEPGSPLEGRLLGPLSEPDLVAQVEADNRAGGGVARRSVVLHAADGSPLLCDLRAGILGGEPGDEGVWGWAQLHVDDDRERGLLEHISDAVFVLDVDGVIRYASPSVERLGQDPGAVLGRSMFDVLDPANHGEHVARFLEVLALPGIHGPWTLDVRTSNDKTVPVDVVLNNRLGDPAVHGVVVTAQSAAHRIATEEALARGERRFRALVQHASDIVLLVDPEGILRYASPAAERLLGFPLSGELASDERLVAAFEAGHYQRLVDSVVATLAGMQTEPIEIRLRDADGAWRWLEMRSTDLTHDPDVDGVVVNAHDVTERKRADALLAAELEVLELMAVSETLVPVLRRVAEIVEEFAPGSQATVGVIDADGVIRHPAAPTLPASMVALLDAERPDGELGSQLRCWSEWLVSHDITEDPRWGPMGPIARRHGLRACWWFPVHGADDELLGVVAIFLPQARGPHPAELPLLDRLRHLASLALDRARFERRLREQAVHDALTGLPNRTLLLDRVTQALELGERRGTHTAVLFVDLDRFKVVNDSLGHAKGDRLLQQVAVRLAQAVRRGDTVGRFGGDEFLVVVEDVAGEAGAVIAADRLMAALADPFDLDGAEVVVSASIGIALAGPGADAVGADSLVRDADAAMYRAKDSGRSRVAVFEDTLHAELLRRYELEQGLRGAVDRDELVVLYQPRVRLADGRLTGVEALVRWDRPGHGLVGADEMIPIAEDTGLIVPVGAWVLAAACRQAVAWDGHPALGGQSVSVNLSARQLNDPGLVDVVAANLAETGLAPERLCLEVTESALARDPDGAAAVLSSLKRLGVRLAIDDFGTGYATLDYVRRFSMADELKIDRSFVAGLADLHGADAAIVSAAIVLADALGFETVAEGVETPEQLAVLRCLGCDSAQGWYFGRPTAADQLTAQLA